MITTCWLFTFSHLFDQTLTQVALWRDFSYAVKVHISWVYNRGWSWVIQTESSELLTRLGYYWTKSERDSVLGRAWNGGAHIARHTGGQRCWEQPSPNLKKGSGDLSATTTRRKILQSSAWAWRRTLSSSCKHNLMKCWPETLSISHLDFWSTDPWAIEMALVRAHYICGNILCSNRKLTHTLNCATYKTFSPLEWIYELSHILVEQHKIFPNFSTFKNFLICIWCHQTLIQSGLFISFV